MTHGDKENFNKKRRNLASKFMKNKASNGQKKLDNKKEVDFSCFWTTSKIRITIAFVSPYKYCVGAGVPINCVQSMLLVYVGVENSTVFYCRMYSTSLNPNDARSFWIGYEP